MDTLFNARRSFVGFWFLRAQTAHCVAYGFGRVDETPSPRYSAKPQRSVSVGSTEHGCIVPGLLFEIGTASTTTSFRSLEAARKAHADVPLQSIRGVLLGWKPFLSKLSATCNSNLPGTDVLNDEEPGSDLMHH